MGSESWQAFYKGDLQGVYSLLVVPALFLVFWAVRGHWRARPDEGRDSRFLLCHAATPAASFSVALSGFSPAGTCKTT